MPSSRPSRPSRPARPRAASSAAAQRAAAPSPLDAHLGFWLRFLSNHVSARFQQALEAEGVTVSEWVALRTLWEREATRHADLIQALGITKGAASKLVSRLEEKGLATRRTAGDGAREQWLLPTAAGRRLLPRLAALADANDDHWFGALDVDDRQALMRTLQALVRHHGLHDLPTD